MTIWHRLRYAPMMTSADLRSMLIDEAGRNGHVATCGYADPAASDLAEIVPMLLAKGLAWVRTDWTTVEFSPENVSVVGERVTTGGVPYIMILAGGDWETRVACVIYFDGEDMRGYVPKDGNSYNRMTKSAFGNFGDDHAACERQYRVRLEHREDMRAVAPDMALVEHDVATCIKARGEYVHRHATTTVRHGPSTTPRTGSSGMRPVRPIT